MKKLRKHVALALSVVGIFACLTACGGKDTGSSTGGNTKGSDPVKEDLYSYLNDMESIQPVQQNAITEYNSYVNNSETDSQVLLEALNSSIIPSYESYLDQLNAVAPATSEVQNMKTICVDGANKQLAALNKVVDAIEACDTNMLSEADTLIAESESIFTDYEMQLSVLASEHEISLISSRTLDQGGQEESTADAGTAAE